MRKLILLVVTLAVLDGCASRPPTCDGTDRRPINVSAQTGATYPSCGTAA
ncbi:hypothetical protein NX784_27965 [Massilia pinisoli]|uniref:Lipoprotein n=1 Tax=Massilia pinisoli TaxID=1772194 RepID=A0ABT1ZZR8_9BURK|nr:hypothetical protein [Massilia pinisoli]MCS0585423.1 hypothetical protein [Massilia pinisoli]